jgi:hypothetical protein
MNPEHQTTQQTTRQQNTGDIDNVGNVGYDRDAAIVDPILHYFAWRHLPGNLQTVSKPFAELADVMVRTLPRNAERSAGLRKLLEAKDCAVRALIPIGDAATDREATAGSIRG